MSDVTAVMRVLGRGEHELKVDALDTANAWSVQVPGFGALVIGRAPVPDEPIVRLAARLAPMTWKAILVQPDPMHRFSERSHHVERTVTVADDGALEVELLGKADRLTVRVFGAIDMTQEGQA